MKPDPDFPGDQRARLNRLGLTDEESIAANENVATTRPLTWNLGVGQPQPPLLPVEKIVELATIEGHCDGFNQCAPSPSVRFIQLRLQWSNVCHLRAFVEAYEAAYKARKETM